MPIKHLVIAGGGLLGFRYFGALKHLEETGFWKRENVESIYGTSIGSIIGTFITLNYDWNTLENYIVEKPWRDEFSVSGKQIFDTYSTKGLYGIKLFESIFKSLLGGLELPLDITLQQLYEFNPIDLHIYTFELNSYQTVDLSHTTHPNLPLLEAIAMSCAIPGLIQPTIKEDGTCYIDGSLEYNYPMPFCLKNVECTDDILGVQSILLTDNHVSTVTSDTNILDFFIKFSIKTIIHLSKKQNTMIHQIKNEVQCHHEGKCMTLEFFEETIRSKEKRRQNIIDGKYDAELFLSLIKNIE